MQTADPVSACGSSTVNLYVFLVALSLLLAVVGYLGSTKMQMRSPIVASCSLANSAACHPPDGEKDTHLAQVNGGVIDQATAHTVGHCSLSTGMVREPKVGKAHL
jgi:hypothetical protein